MQLKQKQKKLLVDTDTIKTNILIFNFEISELPDFYA